MTRYLKLTTILAVLGLVFLLAACGGDDDDTGDTGDNGDDNGDTGDDNGDDGDDNGDDGDTGGEFDAEEHYAGRTVRFVTTSGAGGGTDARIRAFASAITSFVPGEPGAQVSNVTPHVAGINFMWNADPDGYTIAMTSAPTLEFELFEGAEWDSSQFQFAGSMDPICDNMLLVRGDLGYDSVEEISGGDETLIGMTAAPSPSDVEPIALGVMLVADYLDWPMEIKRVAESGSAAQELALQRDEVNFYRAGTDWCRIPSNHPDWFPDEFVIPILDMGVGGPGHIPDEVAELGFDPPHLSEVLNDEQWEQWRGLVAATRAGGNPVFFPPETPQEIVDVWREALDEAMQDEDFVEIVGRTFGGEPFDLIEGEDAQQLFTENRELLLEFSDQYEALADDLYGKYVN